MYEYGCANPPQEGLFRLRSAMPRGFTLVELLVVIAIISVLAGLLLPALDEALTSARMIACMNQHRQFYLGLQGYADDFEAFLPGGTHTNNGRAWLSYNIGPSPQEQPVSNRRR